MLSESEIKQLLSDLERVKSEVRDLKIKLGGLDRKKEDAFREKRKISSDIFSRIKVAKDYKDKRNSLTEQVKSGKHSREEIEEKIKILEEEVHKLKDEKRKILEKTGVESPDMLRRNIKKLEFRIETEGLTFEKEKELMKVLSKMKKQLESTKAASGFEEQLSGKYRELRDLRSMIDMTRKIVVASAKESQKHHTELIESSKEIDELKKKESESEETALGFKTQMHELGEELDKKIAQMNELRKKLEENNVKLKEDTERSGSELLRQKDQEVQEKIKSGKKLTTEDLLILQRTMKN